MANEPIKTDPALNPPVKVADSAVVDPALASKTNDPPLDQKANKPVRPKDVPDAYWDETKGVLADKLLADHLALTAAQPKDVPAKAEDYKFVDPADLQLPEGFLPEGKKTYVEAVDPELAGMLRGWAVKYRIPQSAINELIANGAKVDVAAFEAKKAEAAERQAAVDKQFETLGTNAQARLEAIGTFFKAEYGDAAKAFIGNFENVAAIPVIEHIMSRLKGTNVIPFNQKRETPDQGPQPPDTSKMSAAQAIHAMRQYETEKKQSAPAQKQGRA